MTLLMVVAGLAAPAFVACGGGGTGATPTPTHSVAPSPSIVGRAASETPASCNQVERTTPGSSDAWAQAAAAIGNPSIVLKPGSLPSDFGAAKLDSVCNSGGATGYTVTYTGTNGLLALCLDRCGAAFGNFPGPPAYGGYAPIRGANASVMMSRGESDGSAGSAYSIEWNEHGERYVARLASSQLTFPDLEAVVTSLAPMAGSEPPTAGAPSTGAASSATPVPTATPEQCSEPSPTSSSGDAWAQVATALGSPGPVLMPASVPSALGEPRLASICNAPGAPQYTVVYGSGSESLVLCLSECARAAAFPGTPDSVAGLDLRGTNGSLLSLPQPEASTAASAYEIRWFENQQAYTVRLVSAHFNLADLEAIVAALAPPK